MIRILRGNDFFRKKTYALFQEELYSEMYKLQKQLLAFIVFVYGVLIFFIAFFDYLSGKDLGLALVLGGGEVLIAIYLWFLLKYFVPRHQSFLPWFSFLSVGQFLVLVYCQYAYLGLSNGFVILILAVVISAITVILFNVWYILFILFLLLSDAFYFFSTIPSVENSAEILQIVIENLSVFLCAFFINSNFAKVEWAEIERKSKLVVQSDHDALTGILNRRAIEQVIAEEGIKGFPCTFILLDLDNFKEVNDTLGHSAGDELLIRTTEKIRLLFRSTDFVARLGGDEFIIFMPNMKDERAVTDKAQAIVHALTETIPGTERLIEVSCSVGVVISSVAGFENLYQKADSALYESKNKGKSCYTIINETGENK